MPSCATPLRCFKPSRDLLAMAICMTTLSPAFADDSSTQENSRPATLELGATAITSTQLGSITEGSDSYTTGAMSTATKLPLTLRETPQAVTVITRQRMDDQAMTSINDVVRATPGLFLDFSSGPGRQTYKARGFDIDTSCMTVSRAAITAWWSAPSLTWRCSIGVEIVRGATGLVTGAGNPSAAITWCASDHWPSRKLP